MVVIMYDASVPHRRQGLVRCICDGKGADALPSVADLDADSAEQRRHVHTCSMFIISEQVSLVDGSCDDLPRVSELTALKHL